MCFVTLVGSRHSTWLTIVSPRFRLGPYSSRRCVNSPSTATGSTRSRPTSAFSAPYAVLTCPTTDWERSIGVCLRRPTGRSTTSTCVRTRSTATVSCSGCGLWEPGLYRGGLTDKQPVRAGVQEAEAAARCRSFPASVGVHRLCAASPSLTGLTLTVWVWRSVPTAATDYNPATTL